MIHLKGFKLSPFIDRNPNAYPDRIVSHMAGEVLLFERITVIYGNNGSGKSTLLNIIANKLGIKGSESMKSSGIACYAEAFIQYCAPFFGENEQGQPLQQLPKDSQYIKSEDLLYEIKKIQQSQILRDSLIVEEAKLSLDGEKLEEYRSSAKLYTQLERIKFAQEKYSNGETAMELFDQLLIPEQLYLLDEPETSLSPQNQIKLAEQLNKLARYCDCQFIIATHSPFLLGLLDAKIYNLDASTITTTPWYELENMKQFYQFFHGKKRYFEG